MKHQSLYELLSSSTQSVISPRPRKITWNNHNAIFHLLNKVVK